MAGKVGKAAGQADLVQVYLRLQTYGGKPGIIAQQDLGQGAHPAHKLLGGSIASTAGWLAPGRFAHRAPPFPWQTAPRSKVYGGST